MSAPRDRILILGNYPPPYGGIATHLRGLVPAIERAGYAVDVLSPSSADKSEAISAHSTAHRISKETRPNLARIASHPLTFARYLARARLLTPQAAKSFVIYEVARRLFEQHGSAIKLISAYMLYPWGFAGAMLAEEFDRPLVTTNFGEIFQFSDFYRRHRQIAERIIRNSAALLASSRHCAQMYESVLGLHDVPVHAIPYGVEPSFFKSDVQREEARAREGLPRDKCVVFFLGRMHAEMGLDTWLAAIESLANDDRFHFVVAGAKDHLTDSAEALAKRWPDRITVRVNLPFDALPRYYVASDLVVAPSSDERACMGVTIKEAMATGRVVLGSDLGGIREAVVSGVTGVLVPPGDPSAFAEAVRRLAADPARLDVMGNKARDRALELFTMEGTHQRVLAVLERAMRAGPTALNG